MTDTNTLSSEQIGQLGLDIYDKQVKPKLTPQDRGKWLAIDVSTAEYYIGKDAIEAAKKARATSPDAPLFIVKIGDDKKNG